MKEAACVNDRDLSADVEDLDSDSYAPIPYTTSTLAEVGMKVGKKRAEESVKLIEASEEKYAVKSDQVHVFVKKVLRYSMNNEFREMQYLYLERNSSLVKFRILTQFSAVSLCSVKIDACCVRTEFCTSQVQ